jgi:hypothetical protein
MHERSKEAECLRAIADHEVLGLLIVVEHHLVIFAANAGLLVAAERRMRGIDVIAIRPDPAGLNGATEPVGSGAIPRPDSGAEAIERVIGNRQRFGVNP